MTTGHDTKAPSAASGFFAMLRGLLRTRGSGVLAVVVGFAAALAFVLGVAPAIASEQKYSGPPTFSSELYEPAVFANRAHIVAFVEQTGSVELKWHAEYAPAEDGKEPPANSLSWVVTGSGANEASGEAGQFPSNEDVFLGPVPGPHFDGFGTIEAKSVVRQLEPDALYYARFHAENEYGKAEKTFEFTTLATAKPEIELPGDFTSNRIERPFYNNLLTDPLSPTTAASHTQVEANGLETKYELAYAPAENGKAPAEGSSSWKPFSSGSVGTITVAEEFAAIEAKLSGLAPETKYYARVKAHNTAGEAVEVEAFTTPTAKPTVGSIEARNVTGTSAHVSSSIEPHGSETSWHFEYATSPGGPWSAAPGAEGVVSQAEAEALPEGATPDVEGSLNGLEPATTYYVRLFAENKAGEGEYCREEQDRITCEPIEHAAAERSVSFKTFGPPTATTFAVHGLHGEALRLMGAVDPDSVPTSAEQIVSVEGAPTGGTFTLTFKGETTSPIPFDASQEQIGRALQALSSIGSEVSARGVSGGPYTVHFYGHNGEVEQPPITGEGAGLTPSGSVSVSVIQPGGVGYDTHYWFEYVSQKQFEAPGGEGGFAGASPTPEVELGSGDSVEYVGADLPALTPGETYRFRVVATNTSPHDPVVDGEEQSLTAPVAPVAGSEGASGCPNEALRTGPSARLPDCRAYEQVTPVEKGGTQEIYNYGATFGQEGALVGEGGGRLEYGSVPVKYGSGPDAGQSPYFFSRGEDGWLMQAGTAQPEAGLYGYTPQLFGPGFGEFAFEAKWQTSASAVSPSVFEFGPVGGPYTTVASVPYATTSPAGWVAASGDFSKLVLQVPDHTLLGYSTHTTAGEDLYEYSNGALRQANVAGPAPGVTVGSCGATIAGGEPGRGAVVASNRHPVSNTGERVFFEAVQGSGCSEAKHLYVRVNGGSNDAETVDIGAYRFLAANPAGERVLLEKAGGANPGLYLYRTNTGEAEFLSGSGVAAGAELVISEDLSAVYVLASAGTAQSDVDLYRYDVANKSSLFVTHLDSEGSGDRVSYSVSPDGRYFYFTTVTVAGLPGGGEELKTPHAANTGPTSQVYRYDSTEAVIQCLSCASSFDPEPRLSALFTGGTNPLGESGHAIVDGETIASENGDYVFFDTPAALVPSDVDGEVAPEIRKPEGGEHESTFYSVSSDVYEWRRDGVSGCVEVQGCLALITSGGGGFLNILLGTTSSGGDVFFATKESLLPQDDDTAEDIYDARIDGGFPVPARAVECEGDSCSSPASLPLVQTPATLTQLSSGNIAPKAKPATATKSKPKPKKKIKKKRKAKTKRKAKAEKKARKSNDGRGR